jgi:DmsE family decaheme c-type cytochrome
MTSCNSPLFHPTRHTEANLDPGWPKGNELWHETPSAGVPAGPAGEQEFFRELPYVPVPEIAGAEILEMDDFCATCHETHVKMFANNVHRDQGCEKCHGAASLHLQGKGKEPNTTLSFRPPETKTSSGKLLSPAERSAICLQCHEKCEPNQDAACLPVPTWRVSGHAHNGIACTDCHRAHYLVPPGTPAVEGVEETAWMGPHGNVRARRMSYQEAPVIEGSLRGMSKNLAAISPDVCYQCHPETINLERVVHPHQIGIPFSFECTACHNPPPRGAPYAPENHPQQFDCMTCHDPHGNVSAGTRKELCLQCHNGPHMNRWHSSPHDLAGLVCTDCHQPHPESGPPMYVDQPEVCYRCHCEKRDLEQIAHPHQVLGPNGFNCTTCHDAHGKILMANRRDQCLKCHDGAPTMAWHSSTHHREGVACTDCHNPHPKADVPQVVRVSHTTVKRPRRLPMSVDEPQACYKCHEKIYALTALPSHHPIAEGKMVCSDCHDAHGQAHGHLKEATVNEVCYECHAEKEGPFAYEHAPVTENCAYCHEAHGTVENNLLRQPTTFLCLRCHSGHSTHGRSENCFRCHFVDGDITNVGGGPLDPMIPTTPITRKALFTDCTQCHTQIHGSDLPSGWVCFGMMRR